MAKSNFKVFAESVADDNIMTDNAYEIDTQRVTGVVPGIAEPALHNKLYKQTSIMASAIAQVVTQAGYDAMDDNYTGLVANIRHTFAGSVNNIKPDDSGNIDLTPVINQIMEMLTPNIGDVIITKNAVNPAKKYKGTTWELIKEGTFLMSAGNTETAGTTGGNNTHTNTIDELTPHTHTAKVGYAGAHSHTGTTSEAGEHTHKFAGSDHDRGGPTWVRGLDTETDDIKSNPSVVIDTSIAGKHSHTFTTDTTPDHTHTVTIQQTGGGKPWDIRPQYLALYFWIRTA